MTTLYDFEEKKAADFLDVPDWIDQDITSYEIASIIEGGCESGAYMPACRYYEAMKAMYWHGDDVLDFITDHIGELPDVSTESWSGMASKYLCLAVDMWACSIEDELLEMLEEAA